MPSVPKIKNESSVIAVVGLGYVGLPLLLSYCESGFRVIGFDIDPKKPEAILRGESYIKHIDSGPIIEGLKKGLLEATTDFERIREADAVILCVPTPLDTHFEPDMTYVRDTLDAVAPFLKEGVIISLESTTYPGTTEEEVIPRLAKHGLTPGESAFVVYSPEREDPGNAKFNSTDIPKVVGGSTANCLEAGRRLYSAVFNEVIPVSSLKVAELTKLLENIYRSVNIGLVNEMKTVADAMEIDIWEVIRAASTKPFGFTPFYPGPGLGGHCIPIDPFYLTWKAREYGLNTRFIELAGQVNRAMPEYVVQRTLLALNEHEKAIKGSRVIIIGLAYKPDVDDMRESPTFELMDRFTELGAEVSYYDPHIPKIGPTREHSRWEGVSSIGWTESELGTADVAVIATAHSNIDFEELADWSKLIVDTRNAMTGISGRAEVRTA